MGNTFPTFKEGPPKRPDIKHDHGFLDDGTPQHNLDLSKRQPPTDQDRARKEIWIAFSKLAREHKPELKDACDAYEHFLIDNNGLARTLDYERFLIDDPSGNIVLRSTIEDTRTAALDLYDKKVSKPSKVFRADNFQMVSAPITVGSGDNPDPRYPYPDSENWQKTIGGHVLWISASVTVGSNPLEKRRAFDVDMTVHMEDRYNFNPNNKDIKTQVKDEENGRFEIVGLAREFMHMATIERVITFSVPINRLTNNRALPSDQVVRTGSSGPPPPPGMLI
jgi:hypothetical protein